MRIVHDRFVLVRAPRTAGGPVVAGLAVVLVIGAAVPAGTALPVGAVASRATTSAGGGGLLAAVLVPPAAFGLVVFAGHLADSLAKPLEFHAHARIDGTHRTRVLELTTGVPSIAPLEDAAVQRLIRQTSAEPDHAVHHPGGRRPGATALAHPAGRRAGRVRRRAAVRVVADTAGTWPGRGTSRPAPAR